jgi:hypothetical protein
MVDPDGEWPDAPRSFSRLALILEASAAIRGLHVPTPGVFATDISARKAHDFVECTFSTCS